MSRQYDMQDEDFSPPQRVVNIICNELQDGTLTWEHGHEYDWLSKKVRNNRYEFVGKAVTVRVVRYVEWGGNELYRMSAFRAAVASQGLSIGGVQHWSNTGACKAAGCCCPV